MTKTKQTGPDASPAPILGFRFGRADAAALAALAAALVLFFYPLLRPGRVLFFRDIATEIVPKKIFQAQSGAKLLWNPLIYFGQPLAANPQEAAFYPPAILFRLGDVVSMLNLYVVLHFAAAMFFMYLLARARPVPPAAAAFAAVAFGCGGFFISCGNQIVMLNSVAWLPALVWAADRALAARSFRFATLAGLFWGLQVLGGEAEIASLSGLIVAVYLASRLQDRNQARWAGTALAVALTVAVGLSAVQWLLTLEYIPLSNRAAGYSAAEAGKWSLETARLWSLIAPEHIADPNGNRNWVLGFRGSQLPYLLSIYPGLLCVALAVLGALRRRSNHVLLVAALLFVWLALGPSGGLYFVLHAIPGFNRFRMPERCLLGFALLLPLLAADGLERLRKLRPSGKFYEAVALAGIATVAVFLFRGPIRGMEPLAIHNSMLAHAATNSIVLTIAGLGMQLLLLARRRPNFVGVVLFAFLFLDLFLAHRFVVPTTDRNFYALDGNLAEQFSVRAGTRLTVMAPTDPHDVMLGLGQDPVEFFRRQRLGLVPFTGLELGLDDVGAASSLCPADQATWFAVSKKFGTTMLWLSGVAAVLDPGGKSLALDRPLSRAYVVRRARSAPDRPAALAAITAPGFTPGAETVLETPDPGPPVPPGVAASAAITRYENQRVEIKAAGPGWLVLLDSYYPGWTATVDGRSAVIYRANGFFRAVRLPEGAKTVVFRYWPWRFYLGAFLSLATLLAVGLLATVVRSRDLNSAGGSGGRREM